MRLLWSFMQNFSYTHSSMARDNKDDEDDRHAILPTCMKLLEMTSRKCKEKNIYTLENIGFHISLIFFIYTTHLLILQSWIIINFYEVWKKNCIGEILLFMFPSLPSPFAVHWQAGWWHVELLISLWLRLSQGVVFPFVGGSFHLKFAGWSLAS